MNNTYFGLTVDVIGASALGLTVSVKCTQLNQHGENFVQTNNNNNNNNNNVNEYLNDLITLNGHTIRQPRDNLLNQHNENLVQTLNNNQVPANNQVNEYLSGRVTLHGRIIRQLEDDIFDSGEGEIFKSISVLK